MYSYLRLNDKPYGRNMSKGDKIDVKRVIYQLKIVTKLGSIAYDLGFFVSSTSRLVFSFL